VIKTGRIPRRLKMPRICQNVSLARPQFQVGVFLRTLRAIVRRHLRVFAGPKIRTGASQNVPGGKNHETKPRNTRRYPRYRTTPRIDQNISPRLDGPHHKAAENVPAGNVARAKNPDRPSMILANESRERVWSDALTLTPIFDRRQCDIRSRLGPATYGSSSIGAGRGALDPCRCAAAGRKL
jgi:hypothetical protein